MEKTTEKITEQPSKYRHLEQKTVEQLTGYINTEDMSVPVAIGKALPQINALIETIVMKLKQGGRMFYLGSGSGGRLSVLDVIEMPTTFGVSRDMLQAILAGGTDRLVDALEEKEDDVTEGWATLQQNNITNKDIVVGISASGSTPFVVAALKACRGNGITTGCIVSNLDSQIAAQADFPVEVITGPEFISGSTRMKCGSAQKMIFDMISTTTMIQLGRVEDNSMVHVQLINDKITDRAVRMLMTKAQITDYEAAKALLLKEGSVAKALALHY